MSKFIQNFKSNFLPKFLALVVILGIVGFTVWLIHKEVTDSSDTLFTMSKTYDQPLLIKLNDLTISISPLGAQPAQAAADKNVVKYVNAYSDTDVVQTKSFNKIKEDIILKQPGHPQIFEYQIDMTQFDVSRDDSGNRYFFRKGHRDDNDYKLFTIPAPFMIDANGQKSSTQDVVSTLTEDGHLTLTPSAAWLAKAKYPVILDPTIEITILNVHSHPQQGENWTVDFTTQGAADLKIIPNDQATIDDDEFVSLSCNGEKRTPQILAGDVIYYPNWSCNGTGQVIHYTKKAGNHTLRFEFDPPNGEAGGQTAYAYNTSSPIIFRSAYVATVTELSATGGTITYTDSNGSNPRSSPAYANGYTVHTFTSDGTFTVTGSGNVDYLVVGGGGGGGRASYSEARGAGGGGAGGYLTSSGFAVTAQAYTITVGDGGRAGLLANDATVNGASGENSVFSSITANGGGGAQGHSLNSPWKYSWPVTGGGSGGGASNGGTGAAGTGGQGNNGGNGYDGGSVYNGGGGGGASAVGANGTVSVNGNGGAGTASSISGSPVTYAGGGGSDGASSTKGSGGAGGGGAGGGTNNGTANTGGGGGGMTGGVPGAGGSGIVIVRYKPTTAVAGTPGLPIVFRTGTIGALTNVDLMEYSSDALAQAAYVSNDFNDSYTKLASHFDGADGATAYSDPIQGAATFTGTAQLDTGQYKFTSSLLLDGNSDYITYPYSADFTLDGDFTFDFWIRPANISGAQVLFKIGELQLYMESDGSLILRSLSATRIQGGSLGNGNWYHIALSRSGTSIKLFVGGTQVGSTYDASTTFGNSTMTIGADVPPNYYFNGNIDEFRLSKGIARWTSNFSVPSSPYPNNSLQSYSEATIKNQGSYSLKGVATTSAINKTLTRTLATNLNLTGRSTLAFDIRSGRTGSNIKVGIHDTGGTTTEITPNITSANAWQTVNWDISGVSNANKDNIDSIIITIVNADASNTFYLDNMLSPQESNYNPGSTIIFK